MSEASDESPDEFGSPERIRLATATRSLVDAVMTTHGVAPDELEHAAADIDRVLARLVPPGTGRREPAGATARARGA